MMSLRVSALLWTTLLLIGFGGAAVVTSYELVKDEANKFLDTQLRQIALNAGREPIHAVGNGAPESEDELVVHVWDETGRTIHDSSPQIAIPQGRQSGFDDIRIEGEQWRVFLLKDNKRAVQVAQRTSAREELASRAATGAALPLLAAIPLAWLAIFLMLNRLLRRLSLASEALASRSVDTPDPLSLREVPKEISPLIAAMNELINRYRTAADQQRRFVSDAAHELRTPLAALQIQADNLRTLDISHGANEVVEDLQAGVRRTAGLVNKLLQIARIDSAAASRTPTEIDLAEIVRSSVADRVVIADSKCLILSLAADDPVLVKAHETDLSTLFSSILDNAILYTPQGGSVSVSVRTRDRRPLVEIADTGPGIPEDALPRVFERFFRAAPADIEGSGLGLAIAKGIAERNGVTLTIANRQPTGVLARIMFPAAAIMRMTDR